MFRKNSDVHTLIVEQIKDVEKCLVIFENFMRAATTEGTVPQTLRSLCDGVKKAEADADCSLRAMIDSLSKGAYLPSTREDLISIATSCDKIANKCEAVAKCIVQQRITCPSDYCCEVNEIFSITKKQFEALEECISMMFSKMTILQQDPSYLDNIRALETAVDTIEDKMYEDIFSTDMELAAKVQLSGVVEQLCDLSDIIEDIADKIQIMVINRKA